MSVGSEETTNTMRARGAGLRLRTYSRLKVNLDQEASRKRSHGQEEKYNSINAIEADDTTYASSKERDERADVVVERRV